jgi:thermitase
MNNRLFSITSLALVFSLFAAPALAQDMNATNTPETELSEHVPGELLIRFSPGLDSVQRAEKMAAMGVSHKREIADIGVHLVKLPTGLSVEQALTRFNRMPGIVFAEPNYIFHIATDPPVEVVDQWALNKMRVPQAWEILGTGEKDEILIATVDTGIDKNRSDLSTRIWTNPDEIPGNGSDDDDNGYIDDTWGWDFVNTDNDPMDDNMHGTAVSGVMVAVQDGAGVAGVCPWCQVMAVKVIGSSGSGTLDVVASGITYAVDNEARIINLSLGATAGAQTLEDAVNYAWNKGVVVFAAAGNNGTNTILYPAGYANAIAVASTNAEDKHSCFSNYGDGYISVAAPGEAIYVIDINNAETGYGTYNGTSLSAPHTSGLAGLLLVQNPNLSNDEVRMIIEKSAVDLGSPGIDGVFGYGRIDAYRALIGDFSQVAPADSLSSNSDSATGFPHARKLVRDSSGTLHVIWHTYEGSLYRIRYATSSDNGASWDLQPDVFSSSYESYHPALAIDDNNLYVVIPSRLGVDLPYQILFTRKSLAGGEWSNAEAIISGNFDAVRPDIFIDPTNGRLHVIASSYDNAPYLYYRSSDFQGTTWNNMQQFNPSNTSDNRTIYAAIYAHGDNLYVVTRTVQTIFFFINYLNVFTTHSIDGGLTWIEQTQISAHMALYTSEYGISLAGVGDRLYMGYEVGTSLYFRHNDGAGWSDYLTLETGDSSNVYKWPSITQSAEGQAWMLFELNGQLYKRFYDGNDWQARELVGWGTYANLKLGTGNGRVEWVYTTCNGSPFDISYGSFNILQNSAPQAYDQNISTNEATPVDITLTANDPDGDPLIYSVLSGPYHGTLSGTTPNLTYTPIDGYIGPDSFTFKANDGHMDSNVATVSITVNSIYLAPEVITQPASQTVNSGQPASFTSIASGSPTPSVQWQVSSDGISWSDIAGATSTTYSFTAQSADNGKRFHAVFANSVGSATSDSATLTVDSDLIFMDDFNSCNADAWTGGTVNNNLLAFNIVSGRNSTCGLAATIANYTPAYAIDPSPNGETSFRVRFYFNPNTLKMAKNDLLTLYAAYNTSGYATITVQIRYSGHGFQLRAGVMSDRSRWSYTSWITLSQAWQPVELSWNASTAPGANNGSLTLWLDGAQIASMTVIDNDQQNIDKVSLGVVDGMDSTTQGIYFFDDYVSHRLTYIGP